MAFKKLLTYFYTPSIVIYNSSAYSANSISNRIYSVFAFLFFLVILFKTNKISLIIYCWFASYVTISSVSVLYMVKNIIDIFVYIVPIFGLLFFLYHIFHSFGLILFKIKTLKSIYNKINFNYPFLGFFMSIFGFFIFHFFRLLPIFYFAILLYMQIPLDLIFNNFKVNFFNLPITDFDKACMGKSNRNTFDNVFLFNLIENAYENSSRNDLSRLCTLIYNNESLLSSYSQLWKRRIMHLNCNNFYELVEYGSRFEQRLPAHKRLNHFMIINELAKTGDQIHNHLAPQLMVDYYFKFCPENALTYIIQDLKDAVRPDFVYLCGDGRPRFRYREDGFFMEYYTSYPYYPTAETTVRDPKAPYALRKLAYESPFRYWLLMKQYDRTDYWLSVYEMTYFCLYFVYYPTKWFIEACKRPEYYIP